jgi:hypothetical protein
MEGPSPRRAAFAYLLVSLLVAGYGATLLIAGRGRASSAAPLEDGRILLTSWGYRDEISFAARRAGEAFTDLELRSSRESPMYAPPAAIRAYLDRLDGIGIAEIGRVDGISGATVTTDAIRNALAAAGGPPLAGLVQPASTGALWLLCLAALVLPLRPAVRRVLPGVASAAAFLVLGVLWNSPVTLASLASPRTLLAPAPLIAVAAAALFRNVYCRHLCPFGSVDRLVSRLSAPLRARLRRAGALPRGLAAALRPGRLLLATVAVASLLLGNELYVEPYAYLFSRRPLWWLYLLPAAALAISVLVPRLWCTSLCPLGALLDLASGLRVWVAGSFPAGARSREVSAPSRDGPAVAVAAALFGLILLSNLLLYLGPAR